MQTLVTVHSWVRWLVLVAVVLGVVTSVVRYRSNAKWRESVFQLGVMTVDIQVLIGIAIWIERKGWNYSFFFKILHPSSMLLALVVAHLGLALAKRRSDVRSYLVIGGSFTISLVLIVAAIPWDRL